MEVWKKKYPKDNVKVSLKIDIMKNKYNLMSDAYDE